MSSRVSDTTNSPPMNSSEDFYQLSPESEFVFEMINSKTNYEEGELDRGQRRVASKLCFAIPILTAAASTVATVYFSKYFMEEEDFNWQMASYSSLTVAGGVGLSLVATIGEMGLTLCQYSGWWESCLVWKRAWRWLGRPEGIIANTVCSVTPVTALLPFASAIKECRKQKEEQIRLGQIEKQKQIKSEQRIQDFLASASQESE